MPIKMHRPSLGILTALGIVLLGVVSRLIEPRGYGDFDETIYAQTLLSWLSGAALYQEIFYSQGPVFLMLLAPFALILGPSLEVIQLGVTFWGSVGLAAVAFLGYRIGGSWGAAVSAAVVAASPLVTHLDSHALAEGPAISLTALGLAVLWRNGTTPVQGAIAGALLGASLAVKALMPAALIPVLGYFLTSRLSVRRRAILLLSLALGTTLILLLALIPFSPAALWDQLVVYRAEARNASNAAPGSSMAIIARGLRDDLGAMFAAFIGAILLARAARGTAIILIVWLIGTVTLLAAHQPLFARHSAALLLPMALLASGVGLVARSAWKPWIRQGMPLLVIGVTVAASIPAHIERWTDLEGSGELAEAATALRAATSPDDYVLTDMPAIALMADRVIVPGLVDLSGVRLSTGRISTDFAADQTQKYQPAAILFWLGRLDSGSLESYPAMLRDHYSRVWQNRPGQSLWIREDAATFDPHGIPGMRILTDASFEKVISARAIDYSGQVRSGDVWRLRVLWELADELRDIESVQIELATSGEMLISETLPFSPDKPVMAWPPGARRMVQYEIPIPAGLQPSRATPRLELVDRDGAELTLESTEEAPRRPHLSFRLFRLFVAQLAERGRSGTYTQ